MTGRGLRKTPFTTDWLRKRMLRKQERWSAELFARGGMKPEMEFVRRRTVRLHAAEHRALAKRRISTDSFPVRLQGGDAVIFCSGSAA